VYCVDILIAMAQSTPLVTVGVAVYNGEKYIREAVRSVLDQTMGDWELLAFSDASPDGSVAAIRKFDDPRIRIVESGVNLGLVGVRNAIIDEARGTYVAWMDQDDLCAPKRLETQVSFLEANTHMAMCGSWSEMRTEAPDGTVSTGVARYPLSYLAVRSAMLFMNPIASSTSTMRLSAFRSSGLTYRPEFGNSLDYDMWSRTSDSLPICNLPAALGTHRVHGDQTSQGEALQRMNAHALAIQRDLAQRALLLDMTDDDCYWH
jgi:glycosyltransferase involved in cell wall biosynthesis